MKRYRVYVSTGIINGVGNNNFEPNTNIKRRLSTHVMRIYGIDADEKAGDNFEDAGSTYYTDMLGTAKQLGIVKVWVVISLILKRPY